MSAPIRVLIVDDSAVVRTTLAEILSSDDGIVVQGTASDPIIAGRKVERERPDVLVLDLEMPRMDGLTFLDRLMAERPLPVIICSSFTPAGSRKALEALERGAVDVVEKPKVGTRRFLEESRVRLCDAVKAAAQVRVLARTPPRKVTPAAWAETRATPARPAVVAIGASTGGTEAIRTLLSGLPEDAPAILIAQHMPAGFTATFARHLDDVCRIRVKEAEDGDPVVPGLALVAPGNRHLELRAMAGRTRAYVSDGPLVRRHRPSVDRLFDSVAEHAERAVGVLLTGMGDDGARGLLALRRAGAHTIAQDEQTAVVFGMPHEAIKRGAAARVLPLDEIAAEILRASLRPEPPPHMKPARTGAHTKDERDP